MLRVDASKLIAQLQRLEKEITGKLENMVRGFSYSITAEAINNTPFGTYNNLYELQSRKNWMPAEPGSAKGGWTVGISSKTHIRNPERATDASAKNVKATAKTELSNYTLGRTVYITNSVPYVANEGFTLPWMGSLEGGYSDQAPNGIMRPTFNMITGVFSRNLKNYYKREDTGVI